MRRIISNWNCCIHFNYKFLFHKNTSKEFDPVDVHEIIFIRCWHLVEWMGTNEHTDSFSRSKYFPFHSYALYQPLCPALQLCLLSLFALPLHLLTHTHTLKLLNVAMEMPGLFWRISPHQKRGQASVWGSQWESSCDETE